MTTPLQPSSSPYFGADSADTIFTGAMTRLYMWMTAGLALTTVVGFAAYQVGIGFFGFLVAFVLWIGILFAMRWASEKVSTQTLLGIYLAFTAVGGVVLSGVAAYAVDTLLFALALTGGVFVAMSVIGLTTKKDLTNWGPILGFALLGLVVMMIVNIFIGSSFIGWVVTLLLLPVFLGLTVYETKQVKELAQEAAIEGDEEAAGKIAIMGAVGLYLNFINLFLIILRITDFFGGDD